jgi:two-component system, NarL family, response regulator DesR
VTTSTVRLTAPQLPVRPRARISRAPVVDAPARISIGLIGGQRLMREATANLVAAQDGLQLQGTFDSAAALLAAGPPCLPDILLVDCDGDTEHWLAELSLLAVERLPSLVAMLCQEISRDIANYAVGQRVSGVILKSDNAQDIRDSIAYMRSGRTVLPAGWQNAMASTPREPLPLSPRHRQILKLIAQGASNEEIATSLALSPNTVKFHVRALYSRLGVRNRVEAAGRHAQLTNDAR